MTKTEVHDVVVVGSGAAGAMAALRASELGLSVLIVEKAHKFGGTSATSGGVLWVPDHKLAANDDSRAKTMAYLESVMTGPVQRDRLDASLDHAPEMAHFMKSLDLPTGVPAWQDYYPHAPEAAAARSPTTATCDCSGLGGHLPF